MNIEQELQMKRFESDEQKAYLNVLFTASWMKNRINQWLKDYDLTHEQLNVLRIVRGQRAKPVCVRDISERMIDRNSNTTRIIDKLEAKNLVRRTQSEEDRREMVIILTDTGKEVLKKVDVGFRDTNFRLAALTGAEAQVLSALLDKMREVP
jgi:DNA-binding MarR family transcriptional regulator